MNARARDFCFRSIAYLKAEVGPGEGTAIVTGDEQYPLLRDMGNGLRTTYLVDEGGYFSYVLGRHLREAALSAEALHRQALSNLAAHAEDHITVHEYGSIYTVVGSEFAASMLLCEEFWTRWYAHLVTDGAVAMIPARNLLAFGSAGAAQTVHELCALHRQGSPWRDHPLSASLFHRVGTHWRTLHDGRGNAAEASHQ